MVLPEQPGYKEFHEDISPPPGFQVVMDDEVEAKD